jgi:hypothetical protein
MDVPERAPGRGRHPGRLPARLRGVEGDTDDEKARSLVRAMLEAGLA